MPPQQKRTFLPYLRAIPSEALRLGSLYINPLEPNDGLASKRFEFRRDIKNQKEYEKLIKQEDWTWSEELDEPFSIDFEASQGGSLGLTFSEFLRITGERSKSVCVTIKGDSGRRLKIRDPEAFLEEVMKQDGVEKWIRTHASITHKSRFGRNRWKAPELWMCTGVQHVTGGEIHFEGSASSKVSGHGGGDIGAATGTAPPGTLKVKGEAGHERSNGAKNDFGHKEERVWAAQFMPVTIAYGPQEDTELTSKNGKLQPKTIRQFRLEDVPDLKARGIRASQERFQSDTTPIPKLIGRVTAEPKTEESDGITVDDRPYLSSLEIADWESYEAYKRYLLDAEKNNDIRRNDV